MHKETPTEAAYGEWEWWAYKGDTGVVGVSIISADTGGYYDSYDLDWGTTEVLKFTRWVSPATEDVLMTTAASYASASTWHKFRVTRSSAGVFTLYMDNVLISVAGGSGANPTAAQSSHTTSSYMVLYMNIAGQRISLGDTAGNYAFTKRLLA